MKIKAAFNKNENAQPSFWISKIRRVLKRSFFLLIGALFPVAFTHAEFSVHLVLDNSIGMGNEGCLEVEKSSNEILNSVVEFSKVFEIKELSIRTLNRGKETKKEGPILFERFNTRSELLNQLQAFNKNKLKLKCDKASNLHPTIELLQQGAKTSKNNQLIFVITDGDNEQGFTALRSSLKKLIDGSTNPIEESNLGAFSSERKQIFVQFLVVNSIKSIAHNLNQDLRNTANLNNNTFSALNLEDFTKSNLFFRDFFKQVSLVTLEKKLFINQKELKEQIKNIGKLEQVFAKINKALKALSQRTRSSGSENYFSDIIAILNKIKLAQQNLHNNQESASAESQTIRYIDLLIEYEQLAQLKGSSLNKWIESFKEEQKDFLKAKVDFHQFLSTRKLSQDLLLFITQLDKKENMNLAQYIDDPFLTIDSNQASDPGVDSFLKLLFQPIADFADLLLQTDQPKTQNLASLQELEQNFVQMNQELKTLKSLQMEIEANFREFPKILKQSQKNKLIADMAEKGFGISHLGVIKNGIRIFDFNPYSDIKEIGPGTSVKGPGTMVELTPVYTKQVGSIDMSPIELRYSGISLNLDPRGSVYQIHLLNSESLMITERDMPHKLSWNGYAYKKVNKGYVFFKIDFSEIYFIREAHIEELRKEEYKEVPKKLLGLTRVAGNWILQFVTTYGAMLIDAYLNINDLRKGLELKDPSRMTNRNLEILNQWQEQIWLEMNTPQVKINIPSSIAPVLKDILEN